MTGHRCIPHTAFSAHGRLRPTGASFTLNLAYLGPLFASRNWVRVTLSVTLNREGSLQHVDRLALLPALTWL